MSRPPLLVPGRPSSERAAEFPCPFCKGTAYLGNLALVAAAVGQQLPEGLPVSVPGATGIAHTRPACETFRQMSAAEFRNACLARIVS